MKLTIRHYFILAMLFFAVARFSTPAATTSVTFTWPTNGQSVATLSALSGAAQAGTGTVQQVVLSIFDQSIGQWWNGTNYQSGQASLAAAVSGAVWTPAPGIVLPGLCCGQTYQLTAQVTDSANNTAVTNIIVQADSIAPAPSFSSLVDGQVVADLSALGGNVTDNFGLVASVTFAIHELDINYGPGRWWNGTNFQAAVAALPAVVSANSWSPAPGVALPALNSGQAYQLTVTATDTTSNSASATITVTKAMAVLAWDPGQTPEGTVILPNPNTNGGNYWFQIIPQSPAVGVWRTALNVAAGQASVYMSQGWQPNTNSYNYGSHRAGANGFVVDSSQYQPGQNWYILVNASVNSQWSLVTGDVYVYNLGPLAGDASSSTNAPIGAEGMIFFKTTISSDTLAWRLWLNGAPNMMYVKKSAAPDPAGYDLTQAGQMLVVPPYLAGGTFNGSYFIGVAGDPATIIQFDSRRHAVADLAFSSLTNLVVAGGEFPYRTFRVQVPVQQIAWQLNLAPASGNPAIAVRRDLVPNEFRNDAYSEVPPGVGASVALVPPPPNSGSGTPGLSDGTFFVTIYSAAPYSCAFTNANPVITDVHYLFSITNDVPARAGWRYYRITTIEEQLGTLGWQLLLSNQVAGTEIALRRNAVPGQWNYRNYDNAYWSQSLGYVDLASTSGLLQQPGHQADIWYIGVYTPTQALGSFVLRGSELTGQPLPFDGAGSSVSVLNQPAGQWGFFQVTVPADANLLGWDVRLVGVSKGKPQLVVSRDTLPGGFGQPAWPSWYWPYSTNWPSGYRRSSSGADWTGCSLLPMLAVGMGNPLEPGTYYIGVQDAENDCSYTLQSRGIGLANYSIRVRDLDVNGSASNPALNAGEADYYRVVVPGNAPDWKLQLQASVGELLLKVQKDYLPQSFNYDFGSYGSVYDTRGGQWMIKPGDEQWALLPPNGQSNVVAGTYYAAVYSQGQDLTNRTCNGPGSGLGSGSSSYSLRSALEPVSVLASTLSYGTDLVLTNSQAGGEMKLYQFNVPAGIASVEVRLENRVGNPVMYLNAGTVPVGPGQWGYNAYGNYGGTNAQWQDASLITVANPSGPFSLSVYGSTINDTYGNPIHADASYVLRVHAVPPPLVAFDGGTYTVTNQAAGHWGFFQVTVPADANLLGWDVRLVGVSKGKPQLVVSRDTLPGGFGQPAWPSWYWPYSTNWPSGYRRSSSGADWTGCSLLPMLAVGMGNPLEPGTYYIGVQDAENDCSYTLQSRGIGLANYSIRVRDLDVNGSASNPALNAGEADYYRVVVPGNAPDWKLQLQASVGELLLKVQKDYLPQSFNYDFGSYGSVYDTRGGQWMIKPGDEQWALLPPNGQSNVVAGTYYAAVYSQGQDLTNRTCNGPGSGLGSGSSSYSLRSALEPVSVLASTLSYGTDLVLTNSQAGGEMKLYQFNVPAGIASIEVRLENRVGNPVLCLNAGTVPVGPGQWGYNAYGNYGGTNAQWQDASLITVANPSGPFSLSVYGSTLNDMYGNPIHADASYVLRVHAPLVPQLSFSPELDSGGLTNVASDVLADAQHTYYQVTVPASVAGAPVLGWKLDLTALSGSPSVRVRQNLLPDANICDTTTYGSGTVIIAPPYLTPGIWYVDVKGSGSTAFSLASSAVTTNALAHSLWIMPQRGQTNTAPGLGFPLIGDSGVDTNGNPILDSQTGTVTDQGIDLKQGHFDLYAIAVPTNNFALLRTELRAISGNPNLYLRVGAAPTLNHYGQGSCDWWDQLVDRQLTGNTTEYGNWVPLNGRYQTELTNGLWFLGVQAGGNANARYRLLVTCGNPVTNGLVQDLALNGGSFINQHLTGGDWRYYRVHIPDPAPANWTVTWSRSLGSVRMFVRDAVPPGDGKNPADFSNSTYNPGLNSTDLQTWNSDAKNQGPYPRFDYPGTCNLSTPPLRPGTDYYLGFWSPDDATFSVSSASNGGPVMVTNSIAFYGGSITNILPGYGCLLYRMDVPPEATRILFNAGNSANVVLSLEQGTLALPGGPAHWTSYQYNNSQNPNQANVGLNQFLGTPNNWPWLPGRTYYLTVTNTSANPETFGLLFSTPADLCPISASAPTNVISTRPNPVVQVVWAVTNQGVATASSSWYDSVWFSTNGVLDANSVNVGNFWVFNQTLPVGGVYGQTNTVTLPMTGSGAYTLFVQVDAGNLLYEASLRDKISAPMDGTFTLTPPDLMPISVIAPATTTATQANPAIQVAWGVTNQGIGAASGGWMDRVWFSTNGLLDAQSVDIGDFSFNQTMPPGGIYWQTNLVTLPIRLGGTYNYTLFVQVDIYSWLYESSEVNNITVAVPGTLMLDLPPQIVAQPASQLAAPGGSATFSVAATGTPPLRYQWRFNNALLAAATNATLALDHVQAADSGNYLVVVSNAFGAVTSRVAGLVVANAGTNCASAPAGLADWWPGEGNGNDVIGLNSGIPIGGVSFVPGLVGQAFSLDGSSGFLATSLRVTNPENFTLELWFNTTTAQGGELIGFADSQTNSPGNYDRHVYMDNSGKLHFGIYSSGQQMADSASAYNDGSWHHAAATMSTVDGTCLYVDGTLVASNPSATNASNYAGWWRIGQNSLYWPYQPSSFYFRGLIDEVGIYSRVLSFDEVASNYLAGAFGKCPTVPPVLLDQPQNQTVLAGSNVVLSASAIGQQPLFYHWQKDGAILTDGGNISGSTSASLVLSNISAAAGGTYSVVVSNAYGLAVSTGAVVSVSIMQDGGFEAGNLGGWTQSGNTSGTGIGGGSAYVHSGAYGLKAGPSGSLGYLSQTVATSAGQSYLLSFWLNSPGGSPNEFLVGWNGYTLFDQTNIPAIGWTNMQFLVSATGANTLLQFGFRNDPNYFGLDDISLSLVSAPAPRLGASRISTNGGFQLAVYGQIGLTYTLQASTNLVDWQPVTTFASTNSPAYLYDSAATNTSRRFYRVKLGP